MKKLKKLKSKKGVSMIEFTISIFVFLILFIATYEIFIISYKYLLVSNYANDIARTISIQSGVQTSAPPGFQGGSNNYMSSLKLMNSKEDIAEQIGSDDDDINIEITYKNSSGSEVKESINSNSNIKIPYLKPFKITVSYKAKLEIINSFIENSLGTIVKHKMGVAEFIDDYSKDDYN